MEEIDTQKVVSERTYIIKFTKDATEQKMHITFVSSRIPEIDATFSIYLKTDAGDIVSLHDLLKSMNASDRVEIKFIKGCTCTK